MIKGDFIGNKKILNNNVVVTENDQNQEMVVMGNGLAFKKRVGQNIETSKIEKTFILKSEGISEKLSHLLQYTSEKYLDIASEILEYAKSRLSYKLNDYLYIALTDHISFALTRYEQGIQFKNTLLYEVRKYYKQEYEIGLEAVEIIKQRTGTMLDENEAGSIALHLVNSGISEENMELAVNVTEKINSILNIVKYHYNIEIDETTINYERFLSHLRFFVIRFIRNERIESTTDSFFYEQVITKYPTAFSCTEKIATYLENEHGWGISSDEKLYLTVHIHRVTFRQQNNKNENG